MKFIATIEVDLDVSPIGTKSRFASELLGRTILARTIEQVAQATKLAGVFVVCPLEQQDRCAKLIEGTPALLRTHDVGPPAYRQLVRVGRKWSLDGWRGGIGGASVLDEYLHAAVAAGLAVQEGAGAVVVVPGPVPLIDPKLIDDAVEHFCAATDDTRLAFSQTPPGLSALIFQTELLKELADSGIPPGWTMSYKPDRPEMDLAFRKCCCSVSQPLRHAAGRLIADTTRSVETIHEYLSQHEYTTAEHVAQWLIQREARAIPRLPREVEIELTTDDPGAAHDGVPLRPRPLPDQCRGPIDVQLVRRLADELAAYDDSLVVLGGFGDPLAHPGLADILQQLREAGVYGVALRTNGVGLDDARIRLLQEHRVDVLTVTLDAWSPELYRRLHGRDIRPVLEAISRLARAREQAQQVEPLIIPEMVKSAHTVDEMDSFFDGWLRKNGWAGIVGYSTYAGVLPDYRVVDMSPPVRFPCRRVRHRCMVLADGSILACDQDCNATRPIGSLHEGSLADIWTGTAMTELRTHHDNARYDADPVCAKCDEWHRP